MAAVHALDLSDRDFNAISDGQRQRVLLARAICQEPEIIILDEPTSFLDIRHKLQLLSILRSMAKQKGITVIMSLHEIDLAQKISDKVVCVKGDHIARFGAPEDVLDGEAIRALYSLDQGFYDPLFGSIELPRPEGEARYSKTPSRCSASRERKLSRVACPPFCTHSVISVIKAGVGFLPLSSMEEKPLSILAAR